MKKYKTINNEIVEWYSKDPKDLAMSIWRISRAKADYRNVFEWAESHAKRVKKYDGNVVRTDTMNNYIDDLLKCGHLIKVKN